MRSSRARPACTTSLRRRATDSGSTRCATASAPRANCPALRLPRAGATTGATDRTGTVRSSSCRTTSTSIRATTRCCAGTTRPCGAISTSATPSATTTSSCSVSATGVRRSQRVVVPPCGRVQTPGGASRVEAPLDLPGEPAGARFGAVRIPRLRLAVDTGQGRVHTGGHGAGALLRRRRLARWRHDGLRGRETCA